MEKRFQSGKRPVPEEDEGYVVEPPVDEVWQDFSEYETEALDLRGREARKGRKSASGAELPPDSTSFMQWAGLYVREVVAASRSVKTAQAKRADLSRFVGFYLEVAGDDIRPWSPGVTASFLEELSREVSPVNGRRYQSSTLERILATVRHFGRWVDQRGGLPGGEPCQGVVVPPGGPLARAKVVWGEEEILRLREAAVALCQRESAAKLPWRDRVVLELLLLGFRPGEVGILRKSQLRSGGIPWKLVWVVRRGKKEPVEMALSPEAAAAMEDYFREVRGRGPGLLLRSRQGRPLATRDVERGMERVLERVNWGRQRRR